MEKYLLLDAALKQKEKADEIDTKNKEELKLIKQLIDKNVDKVIINNKLNKLEKSIKDKKLLEEESKILVDKAGIVVPVQNERAKNQQLAQAKAMKEQEIAFMKKNNMSREDFDTFKNKAKTHRMTLDDVNYVLNRDKVSANVAQSTKKDMLNQMKNVQNMPTTASGANSQGSGHKSQDREVFENILGFDSGTDNLFG